MTSTVRDLLLRAALPGESGRLEAEILLGHCLGQSRTALYTRPEQQVGDGDVTRYDALLEQRRRGMPVAYLTGEREFWSLSLAVDQHTLIPRPETELLVEWALELELPASARVADWGTGSGAIALALASERPHWQLLALDSSAGALAVARDNLCRLGLHNVSLLQANWGDATAGSSFDLLVSNPPYVAEGDAHLAQGDLRFEPATALAAGPDGLDAIRRIVDAAAGQLRAGGWLLLEHGFDQAAAVRELLAAAGFLEVDSRSDLAGHLRATGGRRP